MAYFEDGAAVGALILFSIMVGAWSDVLAALP